MINRIFFFAGVNSSTTQLWKDLRTCSRRYGGFKNESLTTLFLLLQIQHCEINFNIITNKLQNGLDWIGKEIEEKYDSDEEISKFIEKFKKIFFFSFFFRSNRIVINSIRELRDEDNFFSLSLFFFFLFCIYIENDVSVAQQSQEARR